MIERRFKSGSAPALLQLPGTLFASQWNGGETLSFPSCFVGKKHVKYSAGLSPGKVSRVPMKAHRTPRFNDYEHPLLSVVPNPDPFLP